MVHADNSLGAGGESRTEQKLLDSIWLLMPVLPKTASFLLTSARPAKGRIGRLPVVVTHPKDERFAGSSVGSSVLKTSARRGHGIEVFVLVVALLLVNLAQAAFQKPFPFHDREGWEGASYLAMARQVAAAHFPVSDDAPEVYRLGGPALAGLMQRFTGCDLLVCFRLVNGMANALTTGLLIVWLRRFLVDWRVRTALVLVFLLQWDAPVRWLYFFPPHTDPWMWVFILAGLIAVDRYREQPTAGRLALVTALTAVGVCFREIVLVLGLIVPFTGNPLGPQASRRRRRELLPRMFPVAAGVLAMAGLRLVVTRENGYSFVWTALHYLFAKPWPCYLLSWFLAFGPILWLAILGARQSAAFLASRQHLAVYLAVFAALADMGGSDTERFLYWTMPVVYVLIGRTLEDPVNRWRGWLLAILAGLQLVASRAVFWPSIPEYPNRVPHAWPLFTPWGRNVPFDDLYTDSAPHWLTLVSLVEYLFVGAALGGWLFWRKRLADVVKQTVTC